MQRTVICVISICCLVTAFGLSIAGAQTNIPSRRSAQASAQQRYPLFSQESTVNDSRYSAELEADLDNISSSVPGWVPRSKTAAAPRGHSTAQPYSPANSRMGYDLNPVDLRAASTHEHDGRLARNLDHDWWTPKIHQTILPNRQPHPVDLDQVVHWFLSNSPLVVSLSQEPLIREAQIFEARALFDPLVFLETKFSDRNDPVGNLLLTNDRLLQEHIWMGNTGVRRRLQTGGTLELAQRLGFQNSNARFFSPQDQGTATLSMNFRQPLLRSAGGQFNRSQIVLAEVAEQVAWDRFSSELQGELFRLIQAYWQVYLARCVLLQKQCNVSRGEAILQILEGRQDLDSLPSQIARARSAVATRRAELANAERDVLNAEIELRRIVADATNAGGSLVELIPTESPDLVYQPVALDEAVQQALDLRPELAQALKRIQSVAIECDVAKNQLLPALGVLFEVYTSGLEGDNAIDRAWLNQFTATVPGYVAGIEFEMPLGNRMARSQLQQRRLQLARAQADLQVTLQMIIAEVQVAARTRDSAYETLVAATAAIDAARADLDQQTNRWETFALIEGDLADGVSPTTLLDQLLESQQRLTSAELVYTRAVVDYQTSQVALHRAAGTLLMAHRINSSDVIDGDRIRY
ncbi:MAG TPA: TolC family protein [Pirellulaceae bacterium]|nr:TolC family protein [Pirellulaceae bacterium]